MKGKIGSVCENCGKKEEDNGKDRSHVYASII